MKLLKPKALRSGSRLAVLSPASTPRPELVTAGMERLRTMGYQPVLSPHALHRGPLYYAGTVAERLADLHNAFADPLIDAIICTRGGWGSAELLPLLDRDLIRAHPKIFIGYSDQSSLQSCLRRELGLTTFYGPMVAADLSRESGCDEPSWHSALHRDTPWELGIAEGLRTLRPGIAEGPLEGGCLSILAESLGTPYPPPSGAAVLFLEDIGTKPYQWDRMLLHLRYAGLLKGVEGLIFGDMQQCVTPAEMPLLESAILHALREFTGPIAIGLRCGHVNAANLTLPLGTRVRLDCTSQEDPTLSFLEAAVTV